MESFIGQILVEIFLLPFRFLGWAIKHDFGTSEKAGGPMPPATSSTVWDRELDGPINEV